MQTSMIDKNLLIIRINCQIAEIIYQNQTNIELDRSNEAIGSLLRDYNRGEFAIREMKDFMSKNTKELSDYKWNEESLIHNCYTGVSLPPKVNLTEIMTSLENNRPAATMTIQNLIEQLKKNADKILRIRRCNASLRSIIKKKTDAICSDWTTYH